MTDRLAGLALEAAGGDQETAEELLSSVRRNLARRLAGSSRRVCSRCRQSLPLSAFGTHPQYPDGLFPYCRPCRRAPKEAIS